MSQNNFVCKPGELCDGAACCTDTYPAVTLGDYIRLSKYTGESVEGIWRTKGDNHVTILLQPPGVVIATLGLLNHPCPYLTADFACGVYESRPMPCMAFPFTEPSELLRKKDSLYRCLHNARFSEQQKSFAAEIEKITEEELKAEHEILWNNVQYAFKISTNEGYFRLANMALTAQAKKDIGAKSFRTQRLMEAVGKSRETMDGNKILDLHPRKRAELMAPAIYAIMEEPVAQILASLDDSTMSYFQKTSERLKQLAGSQNLVQL